MDNIDLFIYMNLDDRPDRNETMRKTLLEDLKLPPEKVIRVPAVKMKVGFTGCTTTHIKSLELALTRRVQYVCIFEDDFLLMVSPARFQERIAVAWNHLQGRFDVMFLSMTPIELEAIPSVPGFHRVKQALAMPAMIVHQQYIPALKKIYETALQQKKPHDLLTQLSQRVDNWYGFFPPLARQRPGYSDIENKQVDYHHLEVEACMLKKRSVYKETNSGKNQFMFYYHPLVSYTKSIHK